MEFAPERVDVFLAVAEAGVFHHVVAGGGVGAVGTDEEVESHFYFGGALVRGLDGVLGVGGFGGAALEPGGVFGEVGARELVVEEEGYVRH